MHGGGFGFLPGRANASALVAASALLAYDKLLGVGVGYGPTAGGRVVQIIGVGFTGATGVTFGGTAGTSFSVVSDQLIEVTTPAKAAGAYDVVVQHPNGNSTITSGFSYIAGISLSANPNPARFISGAAMDAVAVVGGTYYLIGATTGAEIACLECATVGPVTYRLKGRCKPYQATGTEFDGVFKPVAVGTAGAITWGATPGSRTAGGMILADGGTVTWEGLVAVNGYLWDMTACFYIATWESTPASQNCILCGCMRTGTNTIYAGGIMRTAGSVWNAGAGSAQNRDAPSLTAGGTTYTATVGEYDATAKFYSNSSNQTTVGHFLQNGLSKAPSAANAATDTTADRRPCFTRVGDTWVVYLLEWAMTQGMAQ